MTLTDFINAMPKVELHVHLEGATQPATLLELARRHDITLPADTVEGIQEWYTFTDFDHFLHIYWEASKCIRTPEDIEFIVREFLRGQAEQHIHYSEVTYTAFTHYLQKGLAFDEQLAAINRARAWAEVELDVAMGLVIDIPRMVSPEDGLLIADWAISGMDDGVVAFGLGGPEVGNPPEKFAEAFARTRAAGLPGVPHAGETMGPESIRGSLQALDAMRIGHGVRCLEDPALVAELRERQIPLEVSPTSNVCLGVFPTLAEHALPRMIDEGLYVTVNSDDPPMFNTTLTAEYLAVVDTFGFDVDIIEGLVLNALRAIFLSVQEKAEMEAQFASEFGRLRAAYLND